MLLQSVHSRSILTWLPLSIPPPYAHPQNIPLLTSPKSSMGQTMVPSAVLATDTFRVQNHFPWSESVTAAHPVFPQTSQSITSNLPVCPFTLIPS